MPRRSPVPCCPPKFSVLKIAVACEIDPRTVLRAYRGDCHARTHARVTHAALALGIAPPSPVLGEVA